MSLRSEFRVVMSYYVSLRSEIRVVVRYDFRMKTMLGLSLLQLFVGGSISYLRYFCLFANSGVQHIFCCVFFSSSCVPCVASFSGMSLFYCAFGIL